MAFPGPGPGRPKGSKNVATEEVRKNFMKLVKSNLPHLNKWILQTAEKDPAKATDLVIRLAKFVLPELQKTELTGLDGEQLFKNIKFEFGDETPNEE